MSLLPQEIAEQLTIAQYTKLCSKVESTYKQKFSVESIVHNEDRATIVVELEDNTQHQVRI